MPPMKVWRRLVAAIRPKKRNPSAPTPLIAAPSASVQPVEIPVELSCNAPGAAVYVGADKLGKLPGSFALGTAGETVEITVKAAGFHSKKVKVRVKEDARIKVTLKSSQPHVSNDLEDPGL